MTTMPNVCIIGLGLIGGSLAKALRRAYSNIYITGLDINPMFIAKAQREAVVDFATDNLKLAVESANVIFLCTPITDIVEKLREIAGVSLNGAIISDTGSTKFEIVTKAESISLNNVHFIGGHPMTGSEQTGYDASMAHLFENAYYVLTPTSSTPLEKLETLSNLVSATGAIPINMDAKTHDYIVGSISHLPHVLASLLVNLVSDIDDPEQFRVKLAAGGFKDITRIASSNPKMWRDISLSNKNHLISLIDLVKSRLEFFQSSLSLNDSDNIDDFFTKAKIFRDALKPTNIASIRGYHDLYVDIIDEPGNIGKITTLLGDSGINIKNLRIIHSREDEPEGCLIISFADTETVKKSQSLLKSFGYKCFER